MNIKELAKKYPLKPQYIEKWEGKKEDYIGWYICSLCIPGEFCNAGYYLTILNHYYNKKRWSIVAHYRSKYITTSQITGKDIINYIEQHLIEEHPFEWSVMTHREDI